LPRFGNGYPAARNGHRRKLISAARFDIGLHGTALEVGVRHWSHAWIRRPNRGQDPATLSVVF
jgi:hypothetical protein